MQETSLYAKFKIVISHLYQSITSEDDLRMAMIKRRMDFIRKEIIVLGDELANLQKELDSLYKGFPESGTSGFPQEEFDEFKG